MKKLNNKIIFGFISFFYLICNFIWWKINSPVIPMDVSALHFCDIFQNQWLYFNAPLLTWIMKTSFFFFGKEYFDLQIIAVNYLFFLTGLYFIYKIGAELKDKETGNIAMILFALTPAVYGMSRQYGHQEYHVMTAMAVNIYCLIKLNFFENRKWSILYGITVGLGLLVKDEFLPYFFTPWLYAVIKSLSEKAEIKKVINILITIVAGSLIAGCHYFRSEIIYKVLNEPIFATKSVFSFDSLKVLTFGLSNEIFSPILFVLVLFALIWSVKYCKSQNKYILLLWFFVPWLIIMFMPHHKLAEYGVPFVPALILLVSMFISNLKYKKILMIVIMLICVAQYMFFSYAAGIDKTSNSIYFNKYNLVYYDKDKANLVINLIDYINKNFKEYNILFEDLPYFDPIDRYSIISCLLLNNISFAIDDALTETKVGKFDIIVFVGKYRTVEERVSEAIDLFEYPEKNYDYVYKSINDYFVERQKKINEKFYIFDEFYLDKSNKEDVKVVILKNKDLV